MESQCSTIKDDLKRFTGSIVLYQIPLLKTTFTDGIKYLAETAKCFWLVTDTSAYAKTLMGKSYFVTIDFKRLAEKKQQRSDFNFELIYSDGNGNIFGKFKYRATDFPMDELRLFFINNTLMLTSEY